MWHKAIWKGHPMRLELTRVGLLVELANHYTTRGASQHEKCPNSQISLSEPIRYGWQYPTHWHNGYTQKMVLDASSLNTDL